MANLVPEDKRRLSDPEHIRLCSQSSTAFCWYLSPEQHFVETSLIVLLFIFVLFIVYRTVCFKEDKGPLPQDPRGPLQPEFQSFSEKTTPSPAGTRNGIGGIRKRKGVKAQEVTNHPDSEWRLSRKYDGWLALDVLVAVCFLGTLVATIVFKALTNRMIYMFQPCHISNFLLLITSIFPGVTVNRDPQEASQIRLDRRIWASTIFAFVMDTWYGSVAALLIPGMSIQIGYKKEEKE